MDLRFDRGDPQQPKGHALLYFQSSQDVAQILATYLVVLPIPIELGKYLPPIFAARMPQMGSTLPSVVPMPPIAEKVHSLAYLRRLAEARDDDLICGGSLNASEVERAIQATAEIAQRYLSLYNDFASTLDALDSIVQAQPEPELDVREVMYSLMGEHDRLQELSKLAGQLRYAVGGGDDQLIADTVAQMQRLGNYFPAKYRITEFLQAAQVPGERGQRLAALYMDRCYKLFQEDYAGLSKVEADLKELQAGS